MSAQDICSSESSDSVSSVVMVAEKSAATGTISAVAAIRPTSFVAPRYNGLLPQHHLAPTNASGLGGVLKQRARPTSLPNGYLGNGCYTGCSSGSSSDDDDDSGRCGLGVDDAGRGRGQQPDMDSSSSSSECSQM